MGRLSGKRTIVTGSGSGIGRATAQLFAAEGAQVLAVDRSEAAVAETVSAIANGKAVAHVADAGSEADVEAYVARAVAEFGGLDVIYANAGISGGLVPLFEQSVEHWQEILRVNLIGPFLAIKYAEIGEPARWFSETGDVRTDEAIAAAIVEYLRAHDVRTVAMSSGIIGCPHEEGIDYPEGEVCPACPYWAGRDRFANL